MEIIYKVEVNDNVIYNMPLDEEAFVHAGLSADIYQAELQKAKWRSIRAKRDALMSATDWTQTIDAPVTDERQKAFSDYRQALRDIPQTYSDPDEVVWPEQP